MHDAEEIEHAMPPLLHSYNAELHPTPASAASRRSGGSVGWATQMELDVLLAFRALGGPEGERIYSEPECGMWTI